MASGSADLPLDISIPPTSPQDEPKPPSPPQASSYIQVVVRFLSGDEITLDGIDPESDNICCIKDKILVACEDLCPRALRLSMLRLALFLGKQEMDDRTRTLASYLQQHALEVSEGESSQSTTESIVNLNLLVVKREPTSTRTSGMFIGNYELNQTLGNGQYGFFFNSF